MSRKGTRVDTPKSVVVGRVRRFDAAQQCGLVAAVSGTTYFFERTGDDEVLPPLAVGEVVTFTQPGEAHLARLATDVRALASGHDEARPIAVSGPSMPGVLRERLLEADGDRVLAVHEGE